MRKTTRIILVVWFLALLAGPLVFWLLGSRSSAIENRNLAQPPNLSVGGLLDTDTYAQITAYFTDHVPGRDRAVRADAWIDLRIFGDSPNPEAVGVGRDGWLFLLTTFDRPCESPATPAEIVNRIGRMGQIIEASGRQFITTIAPNKEALYPEFLGDLESQVQCVVDVRRELRSALADQPPPGFIDMWATLEAAKPGAVQALYYPHDSHWTSFAGTLLSRRIVDAIQPGVWQESAVQTSTGERQGDLTAEIGLPYAIGTIYEDVIRTDVETTQLDSETHLGPNEYAVSGSGPIIDKNVVVWHDSFVNVVEPMINQYFATSRFAHWRILPDGQAGNNRVAFSLRDAEVVVFETTERALYSRFGVTYADLPAALVRALLADLPVRPVDPGGLRGRNFKDAGDGRLLTESDATIRLDLPAATVDRYMVVTLLPDEDGRVTATVDLPDGSTGRLSNSTPRVTKGEEAIVVFDLSTHPDAREFVLRPGAGTVLSLDIVEIPRS